MKFGNSKKTLFKMIFLCILFSCTSAKVLQETETMQEVISAEKISRTDVIPAEELSAQINYSLRTQKFELALELAQKMIIDFPGTISSDEGYYLKGLVQLNALNFNRDVKKAAAAFRMVINNEPVSKFDELAEAELKKIKK